MDDRYLRNAWYIAGWADDLDPEGLNPAVILGQPVIVYRAEGGEWAALEDMCCHRLVPLSLGRREAGGVRCMYHGLKFGADGRCVEIPGQAKVPPSVKVRAFPAVLRHGAVWLWMGKAALADESAIPAIADLDDPDFVFTHGSVDVASDANLIWDNLLDLTHIPFAHEGSFGENDPAAISAMIAAETGNLVIEPIERGVGTWRWHLAKPGYQFMGGRIADEFVRGDFVAPGALIIRTEVYSVGTGRQREHPAADALLQSVRVSCQVVVPVGTGRSRIFYHTGLPRAAASAIDGMGKMLGSVLQEDRKFIEAQYARMVEQPGRLPMDLAMDRSGVKFRSVMRKLRANEATLADI